MKMPSTTAAAGLLCVFCVSWPLHVANAEKAFLAAGFRAGPYDLQVAEQVAKLQSQSDKARAGAAEALGYLRAYAAADALAEAPLDNADDRAALGRITPWLVANLPTSWDSGVFYDIEAAQLITAYLLEKAGTRQKVCDIAFDAAQHIGGKGPAITGRD